MAVTINGTTGASLVQDSTITSAKIVDGSITQIDMSTNIACNGPAFSVYQSTVQTVPNVTFTKVNLQTKEFDTNNNFDNTTNYRFTPTVAGYYQVNGSTNYNGASSTLLSTIHKNGVIYKRGSQSGPVAGAGYGSVVSSLVFLNGTTDYLELFTYQGSGAALNLLSTIDSTYFNGYLARAA